MLNVSVITLLDMPVVERENAQLTRLLGSDLEMRVQNAHTRRLDVKLLSRNMCQNL